MTLYSAFICWLIFNELFVIATLRRSRSNNGGRLSWRVDEQNPNRPGALGSCVDGGAGPNRGHGGA